MRKYFLFIFLFTNVAIAQEVYRITGQILNEQTKSGIPNGQISIEGTQFSTSTDPNGSFVLETVLTGEFVLQVVIKDFIPKRIPIVLNGQTLKIGSLYLERDITVEKADNLITLTDADLSDDESVSMSSGLLQATKDVFLNRAAFDFGQAFFRVRGYDSQNGKVLINGISMNKQFDGRPQWNNWGGLNDVTRNQEFSNGLSASDYNFGGILGTTNIDMRPSGLRPGTRVSTSYSNRTYAGRLMATYSSGLSKNGLAYTFSSSRRWAKEGYINGTLYDAYSFFGTLEYQFNPKHSIVLTSILASNRRGRSSALTEEVFELVGRKYNPYWGMQNGKIRNSRERKIQEPILMFNHYYKSNNFNINTGIAYQTGTHARSRIGYYNAPNPDPTYYRYLPSFSINSSIGANFIGANLAKDGFLNEPQLNWENNYIANQNESNNGKASYVLYDDTVDDSQLTVNSIFNLTMSDKFKFDFGGTFKKTGVGQLCRNPGLVGG
ncbi:hypothetical protein GGR42_001699 [Saonia flava]|uniref:TonB-dependent receptor n=1 Tax=Saonia flava TaxID=523696 RepID=A0A846QVI3_9FLAO|nr:carboxypeptidase-like regulatory domain-containing protein [Saonia flava]NJB71237.1 hypothetical protein [Saonia flava]